MVNDASTDRNPTTDEGEHIGLRAWSIMLLLSLVWGSSYILIKRGLLAYSPEQVASLRVVISALSFLPVFLYHFRKIDWSKYRSLLVVGFSGSFIPAYLFAFAQTEISSSMAGVLNSLTPLFTLLLGILFFRTALVWIKVAGVLLGLTGAALLMLYGQESVQGNIWYGLLVVVGCVCYATSVNTVKAFLGDMNALVISATAFVMIGVPGAIYLFSTNFISVLNSHPQAWSSLGYISLLAVFGTVIASVLFFHMVHLTSALFSSTVSYFIPIVALMWGLLDGETIGWYHLLGMGLILSGVYLSGRKQIPKAPTAAAASHPPRGDN